MEIFELKGKAALVTGASRGIGKAIALGLSQAGATVMITSRKQEALEAVAEEIRQETGGEVHPYAAHNGKPEELKGLAKEAKKKLGGSIDILVNNAGTNPVFGPVINVEEWAWDKIFEVNLKGAFFLSQFVGQQMLERGAGSIINIASIGGMRPMLGLGAYCVSKAGVIMLTKVCANEWASGGVRVNCIAPGLIDTKFSKVLINTPEIYEQAMQSVPMKRHGEPEELVGATLYLASDASKYVTGHVLYVDGGSSGS